MADFSWFDHEHPEYTRRLPKWRYTCDVVSAEYADAEKIDGYLHQRTQGEAEEMYHDRKKTAKIVTALFKAFTSITGQLWGSESRQLIDFGETLGDPADTRSRAYQLTTNVDGAGTNLDVWLRSLVFDLLTYEWLYVLVEGPSEEGGPVTWKTITPEVVVDWDDLRPMPRWMKLIHQQQRRDGPMDEPETWRLYSLYTLDGVERWEKKVGETGDPYRLRRRYRSDMLDYGGLTGERLYAEGYGSGSEPAATDGVDAGEGLTIDLAYPYAYYSEARRVEALRRLPIVRLRLPFRYYLGYQSARNAISWFNLASERRNITRMAATPLVYHTTEMPDATAAILDQRRQGATWLSIGVNDKIQTLSPPIEAVEFTSKIIADERDEFFNMLLQDYADMAREVTATQVRADERSGREALLELLAASLDEALQTCLFLTEQIETDAPARWGLARVDRSGSFKPFEPNEEAERERTKYFDGPVPLTEDAFVEAARHQHERSGLLAARSEEDRADYEDELRRQYRLLDTERRAKVFADLFDRLGAEQAARLSGFSEEEAARMTRRDFTNGLAQ